MGPGRPCLQEVCHLYERLSDEERDELLRDLLVAAPLGARAMVEVLENRLLRSSVEELLEEYAQSPQGRRDRKERR